MKITAQHHSGGFRSPRCIKVIDAEIVFTPNSYSDGMHEDWLRDHDQEMIDKVTKHVITQALESQLSEFQVLAGIVEKIQGTLDGLALNRRLAKEFEEAQ